MLVKLFVRYFVRGCLVSAPLALTIYILYTLLKTVDQWVHLDIPGAGLVITVLLIVSVGFLTSNVVGRSVVEFTDRMLTQLPLVKLIYSSIRDLVRAFVGDKKSFDRPVAVTVHPGSGLRALGFVTRESVAQLGLYQHVAVYFPQSYNFAGYLALVPREQIEPLDVSSTELMTFIISGGVSGFGVGQSLLPPPSVRGGPA